MTEEQKRELIDYRAQKLLKQHKSNTVLYWIIQVLTILVAASAVYSLVKCILGSGEMLETYLCLLYTSDAADE